MNTFLGINGIQIEEIEYADDVNQFLKEHDGNIINIFAVNYGNLDGYAVVYKTKED